MERKERLQQAIIQVVDNQIDANDPPETAQTLVRLISEGFAINEAKDLIGNVVVAEVFDVMTAGKPFDIDRYVAALNKLPEIPDIAIKQA